MLGAVAHSTVKGAAELERALLQLRRDTFIGLRPALRKLAKKVQQDAHESIDEGLSNIGGGEYPWDLFRIGSTSKLGAEMVYVAPKQRNRGGSPRSELSFPLAISMQDALDGNTEEIQEALSHLIDAAAAKSGLLPI